MSNKLTPDDEYIRPKKTITELVQNRKDIVEILKDHDEIEEDEIDELLLNTRIKYITYNTKQKKYLFRYGGMLRKIHEKYLVLAGRNNKTFTVQRYNIKDNSLEPTRFYKQVSKYDNLLSEYNELKDKSEDIFNKQENIINAQNEEIKKLRKIIKSLKV